MNQAISNITLRPGRDKTARQHHPWIFSGAVAGIKGNINPGAIVRVTDKDGNFIAYGYVNPHSQIRIRLLEWNEEAFPDEAWWKNKIRESIERRASLASKTQTNAYRLIYGESDLLPGLIIDRYDNFLVAQFLTAGTERVKDIIVAALNECLQPDGIFERSEAETRNLEGLAQSAGVLAGNAPPEQIAIKENELLFKVNIKTGQKSGYYLDQRDNRRAVATYAAGRELLDCFSFTGGFSVYGLAAGAKAVTMVDSSSQSLALARENISLNEFDTDKAEIVAGDVFKILRRYRAEERRFDMIILDPPKFAPTKADLKKALGGYKDINLLAMQLLRPNGILATFSCSGAVDPQTLQTVLFWAALDSGREARILRQLSQGEDHPRLVTFPESEYLKGFICRVV